MNGDQNRMTSNRPYLLRAVYEWISDNGLTPYLLIDAKQSGVQVPAYTIKDGQVVLNVAMRAVSELELGSEKVSFMARFKGVSQQIRIPISAVLAIYAQENGQGMMFPPESGPVSTPRNVESTTSESPQSPQRKGPALRIVK